MHQMDQQKLLIERILPYLTGAPADVVQRLLQKSVSDLEKILGDCITKKARAQAAEQVKQHADEMRRESQLEGAWTHALRNVWNGKQRLVDCESNKSMLESLLQPTEEPSAAIYSTIALSYPTKFSWEFPQAKPSLEDKRTAFDAFVRERSLSSCEANFNLFRDGANEEYFAGASGIERAQYATEQAQARQKFLINSASPQQLRQEANYETQKSREEFQRVEADRQHQVSSQQQSGLFPPLPATHAETGETIDARWLRKTSTIKFELFKKLCKRHGSAAVTSRLRGED
jgi:hypothetical protein